MSVSKEDWKLGLSDDSSPHWSGCALIALGCIAADLLALAVIVEAVRWAVGLWAA